MSNAEILYRIIESIVFLIPVLVLIWKAAKESAKINEHEKRLSTLEVKINDIDEKTELAMGNLMNILNEIKIVVGKIETKIDYLEKALKDKE